MGRFVDLPSGGSRMVEVGLLYSELFNGAGTFSFICLEQSTFRVSAAGDVTVTVGGKLAMTMRAGEVELFNAGPGSVGSSNDSVKVDIGAGGARVQLAAYSDSVARRSR